MACYHKVYWPKHEDIGKFLKVECAPILKETEYPSIYAISSPVSPGISHDMNCLINYSDVCLKNINPIYIQGNDAFSIEKTLGYA